ncbi:hypothetical protein [Methylibium petroleiphilum]
MQGFGNTVTEVDETTVGIALQIGDTLDLVRVAGGTKLFSLETFNGDLDTGTTLQFKLGYRKADGGGVLADVDNYFGSALTTWQAAVLGSARTRWAFTPIDFNEDVFITATVTAAATGISGTPKITAIAQGIARGIK